MLPRSQRLSGEQLNLVMEKGRVTHSPFFWLRLLKVEGSTRLAVVAPQKIVKTSVARHKIRRQMYDSMQGFFSLLPSGLSIVVCAKGSVMEAKSEDFGKEMKEIFVKSGLLK